MKKTIYYSIGLSILFSLTSTAAHAVVSAPAKDSATGVEASRGLQEKDLKLRSTIKKERSTSGIDVIRDKEIQALPDSQKTLVSKIEVSGAKYLSDAEIRAIVAPFEGKTLALREMQDVANRITDAYRQKGYITSRAILPPQKIENGVLKIEIVEGAMGKITIQGNKYFRSSLIRKKIGLKEGQPFNYDSVRSGLAYLNQYTDRKVKAVLTPGQKPGTTDLVLNVKDNLPLHFGLSYDNYGSRYLKKDRYQGTITHNNLLGFDDIMTLTYQAAEGRETYRFSSLRYLFPLTTKTQIGFFAGKSQLKLGEEFADINARGKSRFYSVYFVHNLLMNETTDISWTSAFDYKDVYNFQFWDMSSQDRIRLVRNGVKLDHSDSMGRTIINNEINNGIPNKWGALKDVDARASRLHSGGYFTKDVLDIVRLHRMPFSSTLLLKGQAQFSGNILPSTEQFQIGGISNVRAYPSGEVVGDNGNSFTGELSFPIYGLSKSIGAVGSRTVKLYDALRGVIFYDWAYARLRDPIASEKKSEYLRGCGLGLRYDLPDSFSLRVDVAWPLERIPSDQTHAHTWVKISKDF